MTGTVVEKKCGFVALIGRPNVGKSTLLNHMLGQKLSITSRKPQTTRHRLLGISTGESHQVIYVDTPGLHQNVNKAINRYMNKTVEAAIRDVDLIILMTDRLEWLEDDERVLESIAKGQVPVLLLINKADRIADKTRLLPFIDAMKSRFNFAEIIPVSALKNQGLDRLEATINNYLPASEWLFPAEQLTDRNARFLAAEFVREKITRQLGEELPYEVTVEIEEFASEDDILHISALILVEREGQKKILIGKKGERLKRIGSEARLDMEKLFESKVMLNLWVKVRAGWSDDERALRSLGYIDRE